MSRQRSPTLTLRSRSWAGSCNSKPRLVDVGKIAIASTDIGGHGLPCRVIENSVAVQKHMRAPLNTARDSSTADPICRYRPLRRVRNEIAPVRGALAPRLDVASSFATGLRSKQTPGGLHWPKECRIPGVVASWHGAEAVNTGYDPSACAQRLDPADQDHFALGNGSWELMSKGRSEEDGLERQPAEAAGESTTVV